MTKNNVRRHYAQQKLIYQIHARGIISEGYTYRTQTTPEHDSLKTRITPS